MPYRVQVTCSPAHELVMSLDAYMVTPSHRSQDLGEAWASSVRAQLPPALATRLAQQDGPPDYRLLSHLIRQCPDQGSATGFLDWLRQLSPGEIYERLAPFSGGALPANLGDLRDQYHSLLTAWHEAYFRQVDPVILQALAAEAEGLRCRAEGRPAEQVVDEATGGIWLEPAGSEITVWLIPQYHKRPLYLHTAGPDTILFYYPLLDLPTPASEPPASLLRLTRTLADESRLRMLHHLASGPHSFMEIVEQSGLTKGTVHRHLWALRFARLVRAHYEGDGIHRFSLRPGGLGQVSQVLERFVGR